MIGRDKDRGRKLPPGGDFGHSSDKERDHGHNRGQHERMDDPSAEGPG